MGLAIGNHAAVCQEDVTALESGRRCWESNAWTRKWGHVRDAYGLLVALTAAVKTVTNQHLTLSRGVCSVCRYLVLIYTTGFSFLFWMRNAKLLDLTFSYNVSTKPKARNQTPLEPGGAPHRVKGQMNPSRAWAGGLGPAGQHSAD